MSKIKKKKGKERIPSGINRTSMFGYACARSLIKFAFRLVMMSAVVSGFILNISSKSDSTMSASPIGPNCTVKIRNGFGMGVISF